jgi:hypothetical protein
LVKAEIKMITRYQIAILGARPRLLDQIVETIFFHISELGIDKNYITFLNENNFDLNYKANAPTFCMYFGDPTEIFRNVDILEKLIKDASLIVPVVNDLNSITKSTPEILHGINGFALNTEEEIERLVSLVLEGLGLLRTSRRLFISYRRSESSNVAIQLFEQLEKNGFDVFLDTHSVRPAEPFQDELWHRMADTDVVVLLNTPGFLKSNWTREELAKANGMQVGILQVLWPNNAIEVSAKLTIIMKLQYTDFGNSKFDDKVQYLTDDAITRIVEQTEYLRARSLASRQDNLIAEFKGAADKTGKKINLHPQKYIETQNKAGENIIIIPTIGIPHAFTYHKSDELVQALRMTKKPNVFLLYDHINIRDQWLKHLDWLDRHLPIQGLKIVDAESWLQKN